MTFASASVLTVALLFIAPSYVAASETSSFARYGLLSPRATAVEVTRADGNKSTSPMQVAQQGSAYSICIQECGNRCQTSYDSCVMGASADHIKNVCVPKKQSCEQNCRKSCESKK